MLNFKPTKTESRAQRTNPENLQLSPETEQKGVLAPTAAAQIFQEASVQWIVQMSDSWLIKQKVTSYNKQQVTLRPVQEVGIASHNPIIQPCSKSQEDGLAETNNMSPNRCPCCRIYSSCEANTLLNCIGSPLML
jgi:hypothetical protein